MGPIYRGSFLLFLIVTRGDNVFFSTLAPEQFVDKSRIEACGKVKYEDSLGSRWFPFNDSFTDEVLSRAPWLLPAVCIGPGSQHKPALVAFQVRTSPHSLCGEGGLHPAHL